MDGDQVFEHLTARGVVHGCFMCSTALCVKHKNARIFIVCFHWNIWSLLCFHALGGVLRFDRPAFLSTLFLAHNMTSINNLQRSKVHVLQRILEDQRVALLQNGLPFTVYFSLFSLVVIVFIYIHTCKHCFMCHGSIFLISTVQTLM